MINLARNSTEAPASELSIIRSQLKSQLTPAQFTLVERCLNLQLTDLNIEKSQYDEVYEDDFEDDWTTSNECWS